MLLQVECIEFISRDLESLH